MLVRDNPLSSGVGKHFHLRVWFLVYDGIKNIMGTSHIIFLPFMADSFLGERV